jgi:hypothetical protein
MFWIFLEGAEKRLPRILVSGFSGEDGGIVKLNAVSRVDAVFSYS